MEMTDLARIRLDDQRSSSMIISHRHKYVFIHGRKTAGTSIMTSLLSDCDRDDVCLGDVETAIKHNIIDWRLKDVILNSSYRDIRLIFSRYRHNKIESEAGQINTALAFKANSYRRFQRVRTGLLSAHCSASEIKEFLGDDLWYKYFKFTVVRNPWDRLVSFYYWRTRRMSARPSFREFVEAIYLENKKDIRLFNASGYDNFPLYTINDEVVVDAFIRFESLVEDFSHIKTSLGIKADEDLPNEKKGVRPNDKSSLYDNETLAMVSKIFDKEIRLFKYLPPV